jgi:hypothetical protein
MLAATHLVVGGVVGLAVDRPVPRAAVALASHALFDSIDHEDSLGLFAQAALAAAALGALTVAAGLRSGVVAGALGAALPDVEIALGKLTGRESGYIFPTHWQLAGRRGGHPWKLTSRRIPLGVEIVATAAVCGLVCACSWRPRHG